MKRIMLATGLLALPAMAFPYWTGTGGDSLFSNPLNWSEAFPDDVSGLTFNLGGNVVNGSVLTNDLPFGPYSRITVSAAGRDFTVEGNAIGLRAMIDNTGGATPSVQRYKLPITAYGAPFWLQADPNTTQIFDGPITVVPANVVAMARVSFGGTGTNIINGGLYAPEGCYAGATYGADKTTFTKGTTILASESYFPCLYVGDGAHLIVSNATLRSGWADNIGFIRTCTIDLVAGGRFVPQKATVVLAQGGAQYTTKINVLDGGFLDLGSGSFRPADDGRFELTIEDGGEAYWYAQTDFAAAGGSVVTLNGGRLVSSLTQSSSDRFRIGYGRSRNAGIDFENTLVLNGGELVCAGLYNRGYSGLSSTLGSVIDFNGGAVVALYDTTAFNSCDATTSYEQLCATVRAGGLVFDTRGHSVVWNDLKLRGNGGFDGGLVKRGAGTLTLAAEGTYTGTNRVEAGTLVIGAVNASACLSAAPGACVTVNDAAYFANAVRLESGAVLDFAGSSLALTRLDAANGAVCLKPAAADAGQRLAVGALSVEGTLRFRLLDAGGADWTANGTYTLLAQTGLDSSAAAQCRADNPVSGKTYAFAVADGALTVTVADGSDDHVLVVTADTEISEPLTVDGTLRIRVAEGCTLTLSGGVTGNAGARIFVTGPGTLAITGGCSVTVTAENATVSITEPTDLAGGVELGAGATLAATGDLVYAGDVAVVGPARIVAAAGRTVSLTGTVAGGGTLATSGAGRVTVADATDIAGGLVLAGVTAFDVPPSGEVAFDGGTLLYTGSGDATLDATLRDLGTGGSVELAEGAGSLDVTGPVLFDTALSFLFRTMPENELVLRGGKWSCGNGNFNRSIRFGRGNFRLAGDCSMYLVGGGLSTLAVGDSSLGADEARPTTLTIDAGADVTTRGLSLAAAPDSDSGADVAVVQNGGSVVLSDTFSWGVWGEKDSGASYTVNGGRLSFGPSNWMNFTYGDTLFDVAGGEVSLSKVSFGQADVSDIGYHQSTRRASGFKNLLRVTGGDVVVSGVFNWLADVNYNRRRVRVEVADEGTLTLPATTRSNPAPAMTASASTVLHLDGGLLRLSGAVGANASLDDYLRGLDDWTLGANGGRLETPAADVTIPQRLRATSSTGGDFVKTGPGALTLSAANNLVFGAVDVKEGTLTAKLDAAPQKAYPDSLVALWTFDGEDPLADKTGHGHDLVQLHGETYPVAFTNGDETIGFAHSGACAYWPACGGSLAATNGVAFNWNAHTVSFWAKLTSFSMTRGLICFLSTRSRAHGEGYGSIMNNNWCVCLKGSGSGLHFDGEPDIYPGVLAEDTVRLFTKDAWHMVTSVRDGTNVWEYIDGERVRTENIGGNVKLTPGSINFKAQDTIFSIGQTYGGFDAGNEYLNAGAMMDDVAVFSRALTAEEVAALYAASPRAPAPAVKVAEGATWNMDGSTLATPLLAGAGTVENGTLAVTNAIALDPAAGTPLHVATPVFPTSDVTVDLGRTEDDPVPYGKITVLTYDTLDGESAGRVRGWKIAGTGHARKVQKTFSVDAVNKAVVLDVSAGGTALILR